MGKRRNRYFRERLHPSNPHAMNARGELVYRFGIFNRESLEDRPVFRTVTARAADDLVYNLNHVTVGQREDAA
jgi:hypothetical protein